MSQIDVYRVHLSPNKFIPLALGNITATIKKYRLELLDIINLQTPWLTDPKILKNKPRIESFVKPAIFLMSDYAWNCKAHIAFSKALKAVNPDHVIIHGGHDVYYKSSKFLQENEAVDFTVHGEGEFTCMELLQQLCTDKDFKQVKGISFRDGNNIVMTQFREPIDDLSIIPSPYLANEFDMLLPEYDFATVETNRGCPFKCAFCSWGFYSRKVVKNSLDRVFEDIEWIAGHKIPAIFIADANFGIFDRDIEIAEYICKLKERTGFPKIVLTNYSNNKNNIIEINRLFIKAKISANLVISIQTTDEDTLKNIHRKPHPPDYFEALMEEYVKYQLPVITQIMIGLPGSTYESFKRDIDFALERKMFFGVYPTMLLANTTLADMYYKREHGIVTEIFKSMDNDEEWEMIVATNSFSRKDYRRIHLFCAWIHFAVGYRTLKYITYFIAIEKQMKQSDVLEILMDIGENDNHYPIMNEIINTLKEKISETFDRNIYNMVLRRNPRGSFLKIDSTNQWDSFYIEIKDIIQNCFSLDPNMIDNVILIQKRIMPNTQNPLSPVQLDYDFASYYFQDIKQLLKKSLSEFKLPIMFSVKDPKNLIGNLNLIETGMRFLLNTFELDSPLWRSEPE